MNEDIKNSPLYEKDVQICQRAKELYKKVLATPYDKRDLTELSKHIQDCEVCKEVPKTATGIRVMEEGQK